MSFVDKILQLNDVLKSFKNEKNGSDFLLSLFKTLKDEPQKLTELLKNLNVSIKDLEGLLKKTDDSQIQQLVTNIAEKLAANEEKTEAKIKKTEKEPLKTANDKDSKLKTLLLSVRENSKTHKEVKKDDIKTKHTPENIERFAIDVINEKTPLKEPQKKEILNVLKKITFSHLKMKNITLNDRETKEFREIKSFKQLIEFADKKGLNIEKIVIKELNQKEETLPKLTLPKSKIVVKPPQKSKNTDISPEKHTKKNVLKKLLSPQIKEELKTSEKNIQKNEKHNLSDGFNTETKPNIIDTLKYNITKAKNSLKHFASNLKEAVENYKPPVTKLSIEMNPKELGKVEVTIIHRGENIQIKINSNSTAVNFLHSQQTELKQNLISMGYSEVNMSFNSNQQQSQKKYRHMKFNSDTNEENEELIIEIPYKYA